MERLVYWLVYGNGRGDGGVYLVVEWVLVADGK